MLLVIVTGLLVLCACSGTQRDALIFGTVAARPENAGPGYTAGLRVVTFDIYWDRLQPAPDRFDTAQFDQARRDLTAFRDAGMHVVLDLGVQYPPAWTFDVPHSRYVNQYGDVYIDARPGSNGLNAIFNQQVRDLQAAYVARVFEELGSDFYAVRLGWCFYGELSYPSHNAAGRPNAYWAFDDLAQGRDPGLATTLAPNPVPEWIPGTPSPDHASARSFLNWLLDALTDYQTWQIATVRRHFDGRLAMLYPSWGIRPGQLQAAVTGDLSGFTSPEQNGEIQRGYDVARHIASLSDPDIVVYTTWLDAPTSSDNEMGDDPTAWSPAHYLSQLAAEHRPSLAVWGENTGSGSVEKMQLCFERLEAFGLTGLFWAFDAQLYDASGDTASIDDYATLIAGMSTR